MREETYVFEKRPRIETQTSDLDELLIDELIYVKGDLGLFSRSLLIYVCLFSRSPFTYEKRHTYVKKRHTYVKGDLEKRHTCMRRDLQI